MPETKSCTKINDVEIDLTDYLHGKIYQITISNQSYEIMVDYRNQLVYYQLCDDFKNTLTASIYSKSQLESIG